MSIERFFTTTFTVTRMSWSNESSAEVSAGSFLGHIQQARPDYAESIGESWNQTFLLWCDEDTDIEDGDTVTVASGDYAGSYSVRNVQKNAVGSKLNQHLEVTIVKD